MGVRLSDLPAYSMDIINDRVWLVSFFFFRILFFFFFFRRGRETALISLDTTTNIYISSRARIYIYIRPCPCLMDSYYCNQIRSGAIYKLLLLLQWRCCSFLFLVSRLALHSSTYVNTINRSLICNSIPRYYDINPFLRFFFAIFSLYRFFFIYAVCYICLRRISGGDYYLYIFAV